MIGQTAIKSSCNWQSCLGGFLHGRTGEQQLFHQFDIAFIIERAKHQHAFEIQSSAPSRALLFYRTLQLMHSYADYLSAIKFSNQVHAQ